MRIIITLAVILLASAAGAAEVVVPASTIVPVRATAAIDAKDVEAGQEVTLVVAADVEVHGEAVIRAGAPVLGFVNDASQSQMAGVAGKISVTLRSTLAVDGTTVALSGTLVHSGASEVGSSVAVGVILCPLALLNKGESGRIAPGTEVRAMTVSEVRVDPANPAAIEYRSTDYVPDKPKSEETAREGEFSAGG